MRLRFPPRGILELCLSLAVIAVGATNVRAATIMVAAGGDLQAAINAAQPGDVIALEPGATFTGNFVLPNKGGDTQPIVIRSAAPDASLPPAGMRMTPAFAAFLPKLKSNNSVASLRTAAAAHHWTLMFLELQANYRGFNEILALGAGDSTQSSLTQVPHHLLIDRLYVHGDPVMGQKRCIGLNSSDTTIINSYVADCKGIGQDANAIGGWNGPGNYLIENNYLEGAAENVIFGGADPAIPNLVTTNVTFRGNYVSKPIAWKAGIVPTPQGAAAAAAPGAGALPAGTYYYKVVARTLSYTGILAASSATAEVSATLAAGTTGAIQISWSPVPGAVDYVVYGRTSATENVYWKTVSPFFTDTGAAGTAGTPASATKWVVKNNFELKNAQDVLVEGNVFENVWVGGQSGYAIQLTPRNQSGGAPWAIVQRITFRSNIVRHAAGGVNVLGTDDLNPSQLANHIVIANNLFDDLTAATWGSGSRPFQIGAGPDSVTIDHNTIITTQSSIVGLYGGTTSSPTLIPHWVFTNNMTPHNAYGIMGTNSSPGLPSIQLFAPDAVVTANVFAGGSASRYPAGNFFPGTSAWQAGFVNYALGDYHLLPTSPYKGVALDGTDLGADIDLLASKTAGAITGDSRGPSAMSQVQILTTALPNGLYQAGYSQSLACSGGSGVCNWALQGGALPPGLTLDAVAGVIFGTPSTVETATFTVQAFDAGAPSNTAMQTLSLTIDPPAFTMTMPSAPPGQVGIAYAVQPSVSGAVGSTVWTLTSGALPSGIYLDPVSGLIAGTPTAWGTATAVVQVQDTWAANRTDSKPVTVTVAPGPVVISTTTLAGASVQAMYSAFLNASGGTGAITWSLASGALPAGVMLDPSGTISGVPTAVGVFAFAARAADVNWPTNAATVSLSLSVTAPPFTMSMPVPPAGQVGMPYSLIPTVSGNLSAVAWSLASGSLPAGVALNPSTGQVSGTATAWGTFGAVIKAIDTYDVTRVQTASVTIAIAPAPLTIATADLPSANVYAPYSATLAAAGGTGSAAWTLVSGTLPAGLTLTTAGVIQGTATAVCGTTFTVRATDVAAPANTATKSLTMAVTAREVVLYAADATVVQGKWTRQSDATAAGGFKMRNPDAGAAKVAKPAVSPASYFELTFQAEAGVPYHLWIRGRADSNWFSNDSAWVQFSGTVSAGAPAYRIGTSSAIDYVVENGTTAGLAGWGWNDNSYESLGPALYFAAPGRQTLRVQVREDGLSIDQVVLSAGQFASQAPGAGKNDTTILPRTVPVTIMATEVESVLLEDRFDAAGLDASKWTVDVLSGLQDTSIALAPSAGVLQVGPLKENVSGSHYNGIVSRSIDLTGAYTSVRLAAPPDAATSADAMLTLVVDGSNHYRIYLEAGVLIFEKKIAGSKTTLGSIPFDPAKDAFWRIRHVAADDQIVFETAPASGGSPTTWTVHTSAARSLAVAAMRVELKGGTFQREAIAPGSVAFDDVRVARP